MKNKFLLVLGLLLVGTVGVGNALTIIGNNTSGYYNSALGELLNGTNPYGTTFLFPNNNSNPNDPTINPAPAPDLSAASGVLGTWLTAPDSLDTQYWSGLQQIPRNWAVNSESAIVYEFDAGTGLENITGSFGVDNGLFIWLDGTYVFGALSPGGAYPGEYNVSFSNLSAGTHYLQVLREDHGGGTGWDINFSGDQAAPVPEPATMFLLGLGLVGMVGIKRRKK